MDVSIILILFSENANAILLDMFACVRPAPKFAQRNLISQEDA